MSQGIGEQQPLILILSDIHGNLEALKAALYAEDRKSVV